MFIHINTFINTKHINYKYLSNNLSELLFKIRLK
jgi:hypothetical protein